MKKGIIAVTVCMAVFYFFSQKIQASPIQWDVSSGGNGHWYEVIYGTDVTWDEAQTQVNAMGNGWHLATITSSEENTFILDLFKDNPSAWTSGGYSNLVGSMNKGPWIGAISSSNSSNDWTWVTGEAFSFEDWGPLEPFRNGNRVFITEFVNQNTIGWNDAPNYYTTTGFIVETNFLSSTVPEPATMLLFGLGLLGVAGVSRKKEA